MVWRAELERCLSDAYTQGSEFVIDLMVMEHGLKTLRRNVISERMNMESRVEPLIWELEIYARRERAGRL